MNKAKSLILLDSGNKVHKVKGEREVTKDEGQPDQPLHKRLKILIVPLTFCVICRMMYRPVFLKYLHTSESPEGLLKTNF